MLNTDAEIYGGSGVGNLGAVEATAERVARPAGVGDAARPAARHGLAASHALTVDDRTAQSAVVVHVVYETHATTVDNENGIATGWLPGELSAAGRDDARELGRRRRDDGLDLVLTSDLARAVQTVEIAFAGVDVPIITDPRLREVDYGDLNGAPVDVVHRQPARPCRHAVPRRPELSPDHRRR